MNAKDIQGEAAHVTDVAELGRPQDLRAAAAALHRDAGVYSATEYNQLLASIIKINQGHRGADAKVPFLEITGTPGHPASGIKAVFDRKGMPPCTEYDMPAIEKHAQEAAELAGRNGSPMHPTDKEIAQKAREITSLSEHAKYSDLVQATTELQILMREYSAKDYAKMVGQIRVDNASDRRDNSSLPKLDLVASKGGLPSSIKIDCWNVI